jgi:hypothetical protein
MIPPFPLYVDEISPDKIKATVSNGNTLAYNLRTISLDTPVPSGLFTIGINGISILPIGRFICMLVRSNGSTGMILLDLIDKEELAEKMSEKLNHVDLQERFMEVYAEIISHPEKHRRFKLVVGNVENPW